MAAEAWTRATDQGVHRRDRSAPNATVEASANIRIGATPVDMELKVVVVPVPDVDRAEDFCRAPG